MYFCIFFLGFWIWPLSTQPRALCQNHNQRYSHQTFQILPTSFTLFASSEKKLLIFQHFPSSNKDNILKQLINGQKIQFSDQTGSVNIDLIQFSISNNEYEFRSTKYCKNQSKPIKTHLERVLSHPVNLSVKEKLGF